MSGFQFSAVNLDESGGVVLGENPGSGLTLDEGAIARRTGDSWGSSNGPHVRPRRAGLRLLDQMVSYDGSGNHA